MLPSVAVAFTIIAIVQLVLFCAANSSSSNDNDRENIGHNNSIGKSPNFLFLLVDDIGYGDFSYMGGIAKTPNIDLFSQSAGSVRFMDFHSSGTVCSPTRATVLTGRNHFRDCVDFVYGCPDQRRCPNLQWEFAPSKTFTVADAVKLAQRPTQPLGWKNNTSTDDEDIEDNYYTSFFTGKWHLGAFYNESTPSASTSASASSKRVGTSTLGSVRGLITSSPTTHGFCHFNATIECGRTMTMNCLCKPEWHTHCLYGHYGGPSSSWCPVSSAGDEKSDDEDEDEDEEAELCCSNYWWDDPYSPHGVSNMTWQTPDDDASYLVESFERFLVSTGPGYKGDDEQATSTPTTVQKPWLAQISFHNCHIPFVGSDRIKKDCSSQNSTVCRPPEDGQPPYTDEELDYYACMIQLDVAIGQILNLLKDRKEYENTMIWLTSDNGPEHNCPPLGFCHYGSGQSLKSRSREGPGSTGGLRGRKRDIYEGGHRVPGIVSFPVMFGKESDKATTTSTTTAGFESWETVYTTDFLPTVMDVLGVARPESQQDWAFDGRSILPLLKNNPSNFRWNETSGGVRSAGIGYHDIELSKINGWGYRHGRWKYVYGSISCTDADRCHRPQLYDLEADLEERHDLSQTYPDILKDLQERFRLWHASVVKSRREESMCTQVTDINLQRELLVS
mmetsp:Transcript_23335/g.55324  ORF Transcript_23335/g.55324 Transcript_23335/m.55324 type:complete len:673 (+) Transcript_23335:583-2601(+)|eukprot:CAMPEP_0113463294 /NCGR_PEP_ID=MMETSP0014_2-20120614/12567_1 /TAXON_ID=2857 /ORGANISM="Nitzschia sp." /LENGTH=672 /DNA_ID=CAMNT_0000355251 /DNA_START=156 /DNA_END=2174 /DNA_ORIENTATION=+ /assembly_acc=CAM_ASM_000159